MMKFFFFFLFQDLRIMVEEYGPVESVTIIKNHQTNQSKGCGFVKFIYREDAIEAFVGLKTRQRKWVVEWATSTNDPDLLGVDKLNIFVGGLNPYLIGKEVLEEKFMQYGEIESLTLINKFIDQPVNEDDENSHQRSAFAFIRYRDESHSATAIEKENGAEWLDRRIRVQYCESQEMKNKRRANKFMQFQYSSPYYSGVQVPLPMMYMGGMPVSYIPPNYAKAYPDHPQAPAYGSFNFPMYYNNAPWLYAPQPPLYPEMIPPDGSYSPPMDVNNALTHLSMVELTLTN
jgi:RNA recognition motif-containing protein